MEIIENSGKFECSKVFGIQNMTNVIEIFRKAQRVSKIIDPAKIGHGIWVKRSFFKRNYTCLGKLLATTVQLDSNRDRLRYSGAKLHSSSGPSCPSVT